MLSGQAENRLFFGEKKLIYSEIQGENREFRVHLPVDYDKGPDRYPVLYITDGDENFLLASGVDEFMSSQFIIPVLIVVAILHKDRIHDLTPTHSLTFINGLHR